MKKLLMNSFLGLAREVGPPWFGTPFEIHTDQGRAFESSLFKEMCNTLKIHKTRTTSCCGGAVVYWIEPLTLNQRVPGSIPVRTSALLSFSKALYPHCCSPPRCINVYPVGCEWDYVSYCLSPFYRLTLWKLPRELRLRTISAVLNSIHWPG